MQMRWRYLQRQTCFEITIKKEVSEVEEWEDVIHVQNKFQVLILLEDIRCNKKRKSTAKTSLFFTRCLWRFIHSSPFIVLHDSSSFMFSVLLLYICLESKEDHREDKDVKILLVREECNNNERDLCAQRACYASNRIPLPDETTTITNTARLLLRGLILTPNCPLKQVQSKK